MPNAEGLSYSTTWNENDLRDYVRLMSRSTGLASIAKDYGIPWQSHPLLENAELYSKLQVMQEHVTAKAAAST